MKKLILFSLVFVCLANLVHSQDYLDFNSGSGRSKRILLVPFDPRIYINDATGLMIQKDGGTHDELMEYFRYQFNLQLYNAMIDSCTVVSLYTDNTRVDQDDIDTLYSIISYELVLAMKNNPEYADDEEEKGYFQRKREEKAQQRRIDEAAEYKTRVQDGELVSRRQPASDMNLNIVFHQPEVLAEIARRRNIDLYLFINEFELTGNYGDPYLTGNSKAERTLKVHFSLYNPEGKMVHTSFGEVKIPFSLDDRAKVKDLYFPEVIRQIIHNIDF